MDNYPGASSGWRAHLCAIEIFPFCASHHSASPREARRLGLSRWAARRGLPITVRVLQIVDVYDALTTDRPYKKAFSITDALQTMKAEVAKGWWDPKIFDLFERLVRNGKADFLAHRAVAGV